MNCRAALPEFEMHDAVPPDLLPDCIHLVCMNVQDAPADIMEDEQICVQNAVVKRRREFSAGRCCARRALRELGYAETVIGHDAHGAPVWPQGVAGSITHSSNFAAAAVASRSRLRGLGIDIEIITRVSPAIARKILTGPEHEELARFADPARQQFMLALFFSAKEAVYKCLHSLVQCRLGFEDAAVGLTPGQRSLNIRLSDRVRACVAGFECLKGSYCCVADSVFTGVWLEVQSGADLRQVSCTD